MNMTTNSVRECENSDLLCQRIMQAMVNKFAWDPGWNTPEMRQEIFVVAQVQPALGAAALERAILRRYSSLWYAACGSQSPTQQHQAFAALYVYLLRAAVQVASVRYNVEHKYAEQMAEDSAQEAIRIIWEKLNKVKEPGSFLGYAKMIVTRVVLDRLKKEIEMVSLDAEEALEFEDHQALLASAIEERPEEAPDETHHQVEAAIRRCLRKEAHQQVIIENFLRNKTLKQIAELLGKTPGSVGVIKHRALGHLRKV